MAACCFIIGDIDDCVDLLNRLLNESGESVSTTTGKQARLLFILAHLEWNKLQLIPGLIPGTINYLKKSDQYGTSEELILKHFSQLAKPLKKTEQRQWFSVLKHILETLDRNAEVQASLGMFLFKKWVDRNYKS